MSNQETKYPKLIWQTIVFMGSAFVVSHYALYKALVVPRLEGWHSVPLIWWVVVFTPEIGAAVYVGTQIRKLLDLLTVTVSSALMNELFAFIMNALSEPGYQNLELPFWLTFPTLLLRYLLLFGVIWITAGMIRKRKRHKASAPPNFGV